MHAIKVPNNNSGRNANVAPIAINPLQLENISTINMLTTIPKTNFFMILLLTIGLLHTYNF